MQLPLPRGPLSRLVWSSLHEGDANEVDLATARRILKEPSAGATWYDEDLQLTLWILYELHYAGFDDVDDRWEWSSALLSLRGLLEADVPGSIRSGPRGGSNAGKPPRPGLELALQWNRDF